ncbi:phosphoenolpyruvate--protein phosphotransferase [Thiohalophilus sp.]|uniref:phosphoenolpyruvate--protein phosphotransferase n=1 Tax=Thiohalophilus sp. TaxID=3028392 RepID=UPI002ACE8C34|nr:phosphoenolpyruvate--protein phosphotransferase [Thiohalophilus sp.]MDZ7663642.1 phosphoenolpyruvate--protein phosphotransferase [Thiohalophilus sp.]
MLDTLRRLIEEVNLARNLEQALGIIVRRVKQAMQVDVCSVYLTDQDNEYYVLKATDGLNQSSVGKVRLSQERGLVGLVAKRAEPVNLDNAPEHHRFCYFPESGEEPYHAFLGVPIIHHRKVVGVLVVQQHGSEKFDEDSVTFLITIAAQLAGAIAHAEASGEVDIVGQVSSQSHDSRPISGQPGAPGVAIGTAKVVYTLADINAVPDRRTSNPDAEIMAFNAALNAVKKDIKSLSKQFVDKLPPEDHALFDVYMLMLDSDSLAGQTRERIEAGNWAQGALRQTIYDHERIFREMEDSYMRERVDDVRDLGQRILSHLQQDSQRPLEYPEQTVLVGEEISAAMLAEVPPEKLAGVISVRGSRTSHVAILARALGVPAVMGATDLPVSRMDGAEVIADGYSGRVYVAPAQPILEEYRRLVDQEVELTEELKALRELPSETLDGEHIPLYANTGLISDMTPTRESGAEGIGLYRTEFPFMIRQRFPGEDEQRVNYRQVLEAFAPRPVVLRTLDVGGDKALPYFPIEEENPFLGWRGIRITLDHPEIFLVQIRAMLLASAGLGNLNILLPMISDVSELIDSLSLIHQAYEELLEEGQDIRMPKIGVMIEVPSAVYQAGNLAKRVDFLSIGTNDLTQYLLAVDRNNSRVAELYDSLHPAVIRAILQVVDSARVHDKPVSVCGEMAGDPAAAILLLGMGIHSLSMSVSSLLRVKWVIRNLSRERASEILSEVLVMEDVHEIRRYLNTQLEEAGMGGLIRAGK